MVRSRFRQIRTSDNSPRLHATVIPSSGNVGLDALNWATICAAVIDNVFRGAWTSRDLDDGDRPVGRAKIIDGILRCRCRGAPTRAAPTSDWDRARRRERPLPAAAAGPLSSSADSPRNRIAARGRAGRTQSPCRSTGDGRPGGSGSRLGTRTTTAGSSRTDPARLRPRRHGDGRLANDAVEPRSNRVASARAARRGSEDVVGFMFAMLTPRGLFGNRAICSTRYAR